MLLVVLLLYIGNNPVASFLTALNAGQNPLPWQYKQTTTTSATGSYLVQSVSTDKQLYTRGQLVQITGTTQNAGGQEVLLMGNGPGGPFQIGYATPDSSGNFVYSLQMNQTPQTTQSGTYQITASIGQNQVSTSFSYES